MSQQDKNKLIKYWVETAKHDYETMMGLFKIKRYPDSLFYGHLVLEKILKALIVKKTGIHPEPIHNLLVLFQGASIGLEKGEMEFLAEVNKFNIKARYPDYKMTFYKLCTFDYAKLKLEKIQLIYKKLCQNLKNKKNKGCKKNTA